MPSVNDNGTEDASIAAAVRKAKAIAASLTAKTGKEKFVAASAAAAAISTTVAPTKAGAQKVLQQTAWSAGLDCRVGRRANRIISPEERARRLAQMAADGAAHTKACQTRTQRASESGAAESNADAADAAKGPRFLRGMRKDAFDAKAKRRLKR
jgi:hypothetical protein